MSEETVDRLVEELLSTQNRMLGYKRRTEELEGISPFEGRIEHQEEGKEALKIRGIALKEGRWNRFFYPASELKKGANTLVGKPIVCDHGKGVRDIVGQISKCWWEDSTEKLWFEGEIINNDMADLVRRGLVKYTSTGTDFDPVETEKGLTAINLKFYELALTTHPAFLNGIKEVLTKNKRLGREGELEESLMGEQADTEPVELEEVVITSDLVEELEKVGYKKYYPQPAYAPKIIEGLKTRLAKVEEALKKAKLLETTEESPGDINEEKVMEEELWMTLVEPTLAEELATKYPEKVKRYGKVRVKKKPKYYVPYYGYYPYYYPSYPYYPEEYPYKKLGTKEERDKMQFEGLEDIAVAVEQSEELQWPCPVCKKEFKKWADFFGHWAKEHREKYGVFKKELSKEELETPPEKQPPQTDAKSLEERLKGLETTVEGMSKIVKEEQKAKEEAAKKAEEEAKEALTKAGEEAKKEAEAKAEEEAKKVEEAKKAEEVKKAEETKKAEEIKKVEEAKKLEETKKLEDAKTEAEKKAEAEKRVHEEVVKPPKEEIDLSKKSAAELFLLKEKLRAKAG